MASLENGAVHTDRRATKNKNYGEISRIMGTVLDVAFPEGQLPRMRDALSVSVGGQERVMEVLQHVGENQVRCILMAQAEGLSLGMRVRRLQGGIRVPVGEATLGRMFNLLGEPIDEKGPLPDDVPRRPIYRRPPGFQEQIPSVSVLETGINCFGMSALENSSRKRPWKTKSS